MFSRKTHKLAAGCDRREREMEALEERLAALLQASAGSAVAALARAAA